jgi:hypothetical protein
MRTLSCRRVSSAPNPQDTGDYRLQLNLTAKQNKAFSQNLGHERIETTDQHYSKLSRDEQFAAMEKIPRFGEERSERDKLAAMVRTAPDGIMPALKAILEFAGST